MTRTNPFTPGTYEHDYFNARVGEQEDSKVRYDAAMLALPEQENMRKLMTERVVGEIDPSHGHIGIRQREDLRLREVRADIAQESRGEMREAEAEPEWMAVHVEHPDAGTMRLLTDGAAWLLRLRGSDFGLGPVRKRREFSKATGAYKPRPEIVAAAAIRALADPNGPEQPPGSVVFVGNPTSPDEPTAVVPVPSKERTN